MGGVHSFLSRGAEMDEGVCVRYGAGYAQCVSVGWAGVFEGYLGGIWGGGAEWG